MTLAQLVLLKVLHRLLGVRRAVGLRGLLLLLPGGKLRLGVVLVAQGFLKDVVDGDVARAVQAVGAGLRVAAVAGRPVTHLLAGGDGAGLHLFVHVPVGEVDALELFKLLPARKARGKKFLSAAHLHERVNRLLLGEGEGDHAVGSELARKTGAENDGVLAEIAGGRRGGFRGDDLGAAAGAGVGHHEVLVKFLSPSLRLRALLLGVLDLALIDGLLLLPVCVKALDLLRGERRAAVFTEKILVFGVKRKGRAAAWALIFHSSHMFFSESSNG